MSRSRRSRLPVALSSLAVAIAALAVPTAGASAAPVAVTAVVADDPGAVWTAVDAPLRRSLDGDKRRVDPSSYAGYHLDLPALESRLGRAPSEAARSAVPTTIAVPSPDGDLVEFAISESPIMQDELAAQHPDIATYAGRSTDDGAPASIRLDVTPMGFHASVRSAGGGATWYVDPAYNGLDQGADALYVSYRGDALPERQRDADRARRAGARRLPGTGVEGLGEPGSGRARVRSRSSAPTVSRWSPTRRTPPTSRPRPTRASSTPSSPRRR